jgi:hypothetical protein
MEAKTSLQLEWTTKRRLPFTLWFKTMTLLMPTTTKPTKNLKFKW